MSQAGALRRAQALKAELTKRGVRCSIELQTGRSRGWNGLNPYATLGHHIVSRRSQGLTPFLKLVKSGRSDLPGPLCNGYGGFDRVARIITMDWANHPGSGGPWSVPGATIPANNGRPYLFGWEFEGGLDWADWPPEHREFMSACLAATLAWMGRDERSHGEHGNPWARKRKIDRMRYYTDLAWARREIKTKLDGSTDLEATMFCALGDENEAVELLQIQLTRLGHYEGKIDRMYGPKTAGAVLAMRKSQGSKVNSGNSYTAWAYWQMQRALAEYFGHLADQRLDALEAIHPHRDDGVVVPTLPDEFTAHIKVVK